MDFLTAISVRSFIYTHRCQLTGAAGSLISRHGNSPIREAIMEKSANQKQHPFRNSHYDINVCLLLWVLGLLMIQVLKLNWFGAVTLITYQDRPQQSRKQTHCLARQLKVFMGQCIKTSLPSQTTKSPQQSNCCRYIVLVHCIYYKVWLQKTIINSTNSFIRTILEI